jgi:hypothetical protein
MGTAIDDLGPVDYLVVAFPGGKRDFTGELAEEVDRLVEAGIIRVLDVLILVKDEDGEVEALEMTGVDGSEGVRALETELAVLLAAGDVVDLAATMAPGTTAGVLIWENVWAAPFGSKARAMGGQLLADGRIPIQAIAAAIQADGGPPHEA